MVQAVDKIRPGTPTVATPTVRPTVGVTDTSAPAIRASDIGRRFDTAGGSFQAIRDVNLTAEPGEFCVIVGPSGCGKTTFLRILAGLEQPTEGTLDLRGPGGRTPTNAMVFQGRSVFPWLTVRDNVAYGLKLNGVGRRERRRTTDRMIELVGLSRFAGAYPHQLSEGMRQRVAIARALAVDPDLLLMDEPFGALDEQTRYILQEELLRIWETTRKTVVFVTHSIDEALTLADRIVVFSAQPGTVKATLPVPFPRPRELTAVRSDPAFAVLFREIWDLLRDEVQGMRAVVGVTP
ncbi:MAG: NitT/TauT family transport system ATP-binding protein [Thermomicrobiales bacterium]|jgi:NitT/TauT family transport system ATP-binding protein|nr:NitT/TauT family transport system ATP-binding protein [Thermomicrobiales bacterium]